MQQLQGTLEAMLATPTPPWLVLAGVGLPDLLGAGLRAAAYLVLLPLVAPGLLGHAALGASFLTVALAFLAFGALGLAGAAFTLLWRRGNPLGLLVGGLSMIAGGVLYPASVLPPWLRAVGALLPVSPALAALRGAVLDGRGVMELAGPLARLALFAGLLAPLAAGLFAYALARARDDGSLSSY